MTDLDLSLGEYQALATKALRGVGFSWGIAEEGGAALRQLASWNVDASRNLVELLDYLDGEPLPSLHCPLHTGATLSDRGDLAEPVAVSLVAPVLITPFLPSIATGGVMAMAWPGGAMQVSNLGLELTGAMPTGVVSVTIEPSTNSVTEGTRATRLVTSADEVRRLEAYAARTYAPATEQSRTAGAGASVSDND